MVTHSFILSSNARHSPISVGRAGCSSLLTYPTSQAICLMFYSPICQHVNHSECTKKHKPECLVFCNHTHIRSVHKTLTTTIPGIDCLISRSNLMLHIKLRDKCQSAIIFCCAANKFNQPEVDCQHKHIIFPNKRGKDNGA